MTRIDPAALAERLAGNPLARRIVVLEETPSTNPVSYTHLQTFDDCAFANARVADEGGVVFRAAAEDVDHTLNFRFPPHHGVEFPIARGARQIPAVLIEHRRTLPRMCGLRGAFPGGPPSLSLIHICFGHCGARTNPHAGGVSPVEAT